MSSIAGEHDEPDRDPSPFHSPDPNAVPTADTLALVDAARLSAATDAANLSDDQCVGAYAQLELASRALSASALALLAEIEARSLCDRRYGSSTRGWFEHHHGRDRRRVAKEAKTATTLRQHLPELADALAAGHISYERVELIASKLNPRNADALTATQEELLTLSRAEPSFTAFARIVDDLARYADPDGGHDPEARPSSLSLGSTGDETVIRGTLTGPDADTLAELLDTATSRLWRQWSRDIESCPALRPPSRNELRAQALLELVRLGAATIDTGAPTRPTVTELNLVVDADRIDRLDPILAAVLDGTTWAPPLSPFGSENACGCAGQGQIIGVPVTNSAGKRVFYSAQQWQLLVCNAEISETLLDQLGMPVAVRERLRTPNRAMRRALEARDGGCVYPGCDAPPSWCDAHHVVHYGADGKTVTTNLALLCRHHHGIVHRSGWAMRLTAPPSEGPPAQSNERPGQGLFTITTRYGQELLSQHRRRADREQHRQPVLA